MKKISILAAGIACVICIAVGAAAAGIVQQVTAEIRPDFEVVIDGKTQTFKNAQGEEVYPLLYDGTTYLPVRAIGEIMGKTVYWYQNEKRIELKDDTLVTDADVIVSGDGGTSTNTNNGTTTNPNANANTNPTGALTLDAAKEAAAQKAGFKASDVMFTEAKSDREDGVAVYEIEFVKDSVKYSAEVRQSDGEIIKWETETVGTGNLTDNTNTNLSNVTLDKAKEIAAQKAGFKVSEVVFTEAKTDREHGENIYEIEFVKDYVEYSAEVRASDGAVIKWETEQNGHH